MKAKEVLYLTPWLIDYEAIPKMGTHKKELIEDGWVSGFQEVAGALSSQSGNGGLGVTCCGDLGRK